MESNNRQISWLAERLGGRYREDEILKWEVAEFDQHLIRETEKMQAEIEAARKAK